MRAVGPPPFPVSLFPKLLATPAILLQLNAGAQSHHVLGRRLQPKPSVEQILEACAVYCLLQHLEPSVLLWVAPKGVFAQHLCWTACWRPSWKASAPTSCWVLTASSRVSAHSVPRGHMHSGLDSRECALLIVGPEGALKVSFAWKQDTT